MTTLFDITAINDTDYYAVVQQNGEYLSDVEVRAARGREGLGKVLAEELMGRNWNRSSVQSLVDDMDGYRTEIAVNRDILERTSAVNADGTINHVHSRAATAVEVASMRLDYAEKGIEIKRLEETIIEAVRAGTFDVNAPVPGEVTDALKFPDGVDTTLGNFLIHAFFKNRIHLGNDLDIRTLEVTV